MYIFYPKQLSDPCLGVCPDQTLFFLGYWLIYIIYKKDVRVTTKRRKAETKFANYFLISL